MAILCDIKILEHWLQVDAAGGYGETVLTEDLFKIFFAVALEVLAAGKEGIILSNGWHSDSWCFLDASSSESLVNGMAESYVVEELLGVIGAVTLLQVA